MKNQRSKKQIWLDMRDLNARTGYAMTATQTFTVFKQVLRNLQMVGLQIID